MMETETNNQKSSKEKKINVQCQLISGGGGGGGGSRRWL